MTVKTSISITDQQEAFARALIDEGRYPSLSAVVQRGLDLLRSQTDAEEAVTDALRELVRQRRGGTFVSPADMKGRVDRMIERKRRGHGVEG